MSKKKIKIILIILLLFCFSSISPFYQMIRIMSALLFGYLAYQEHKIQNKEDRFFYATLAIVAIVFMGFEKGHFVRFILNIADVIVILILLFNSNKNGYKKEK